MALLRLISRRSNLALIQTREVEAAIRRLDASLEVEIVTVEATADRAASRRIEDLGGTGVFTKALEEALSEGAGDCAVHSAKDLPTALDERFSIAAYLPRADRRDALVVKGGELHSGEARVEPSGGSIEALDRALPTASVVATGSARRRSQLGCIRPDLLFRDLRGNMERRISALDTVDAVVVGACALDRLGISETTRPDLAVVRIDEETVVPAAGQGAVAVETPADTPLTDLFEALSDDRTATEVEAERAFLGGLRAGCTAPVGVVGSAKDGMVEIISAVSSRDGHRRLMLRAEVAGPTEAAAAGREFGLDAVGLWTSEADILR